MSNQRAIALDQHVLAVAHERVDGWCAYIKNVPGINHQQEAASVLQHGNKLPEHIAKAIFGDWNGEHYAR